MNKFTMLAAALLLAAATSARAVTVYWYVHADIVAAFPKCGALLVYAPGGISNPVITKNPDGSVSFSGIGTPVSGSLLWNNPDYGQMDYNAGRMGFWDFSASENPASQANKNQYIGRNTMLDYPGYGGISGSWTAPHPWPATSPVKTPNANISKSILHSTFLQNELPSTVDWENEMLVVDKGYFHYLVDVPFYMVVFNAEDIADATEFYLLEGSTYVVVSGYPLWSEAVFNMPAGGLGNSYVIVPEPASFALLAMGAAVAGLRRRVKFGVRWRAERATALDFHDGRQNGEFELPS